MFQKIFLSSQTRLIKEPVLVFFIMLEGLTRYKDRQTDCFSPTNCPWQELNTYDYESLKGQHTKWTQKKVQLPCSSKVKVAESVPNALVTLQV